MSGFFSQPKVETPPLPEPAPPVAMPEKGVGDITRQRKMIRAGRGGTILAGLMTPRNIFKKRLLAA